MRNGTGGTPCLADAGTPLEGALGASLLLVCLAAPFVRLAGGPPVLHVLHNFFHRVIFVVVVSAPTRLLRRRVLHRSKTNEKRARVSHVPSLRVG